MSVEARLQTLIEAYRAEHGDAALANPVQLAMALGAQAPDLGNEIRALAAALQMDVRGKLAASGNAEAEAGRLANEMAAREQLPLPAAAAAVAVARTLSNRAASAQGPTWAGETAIAQPPSSPARATPPPFQAAVTPPSGQAPAATGAPDIMALAKKNKWAVGIAAVALVVYLSQSGQPSGGQQAPGNQQQAPGPQPDPNRPTGGGGSGGQQPPTLGAGGNIPTIRYEQRRVNRIDYGAVSFTLQTPGGSNLALAGSTGSWQQISFALYSPGNTTQPANVGAVSMQLTQGRNGPARVGQVQWQQNALNLPPMCLVFEGGQVQNETAFFPGTTMCVLDAACQQSYGCGRIQ